VDGYCRLLDVLRMLRTLRMRLLPMLLMGMSRWLLVNHCSSCSSVGVAVAYNVVT